MRYLETLLLCFISNFYFVCGYNDLPQPCDTPNSAIYCKGGEGSLLHTVQLAKIYENDTSKLDKSSKTFVDQPIKTTVSDVLNKFEKFMVIRNPMTSISVLWVVFLYFNKSKV